MTITSPTGRNYQWEKETPPTEADFAALQEFDATQGAPVPTSIEETPATLAGLASIPGKVIGKMGQEADALKGQGWGNLSPKDRIQLMALSLPRAMGAEFLGLGQKAEGMAERAVPVAAGQTLGRATRIPGADRVLGGVGGMVGEYLAESREGKGVRLGSVLGAGVSGLVRGNSLAGADAGQVMREAGKFGTANLAAKVVETGVDDHRLPTTSEAANAFGAAAAGAPLGKALDTGMAARSVKLKELQNAVRDNTLADARSAGYVIPGSKINPGPVNTIIESFAGKAATAQEAAIRNQEITNSLAAKALGLPGSAPLTEEVLKDLRAESALPYKKVAAISSTAAKFLEDLRTARHEATTQFKFYDRSADPAALKAARAATRDAKNLEWRLESIATGAKLPGLVQELRAARKTIAQSYEVERALNVGNGNVSAPKLATAAKRLSDELDTIARFNKAFPAFSRETSAVPTPGVSKLKAMTMLGLGAGGASQLGPWGTLLGAAPLAEEAFRGAALSRFGQKILGAPDYRGYSDFAANLAKVAAMNEGRDFDFAPDEIPLTDAELARLEELRALQTTQTNANP